VLARAERGDRKRLQGKGLGKDLGGRWTHFNGNTKGPRGKAVHRGEEPGVGWEMGRKETETICKGKKRRPRRPTAADLQGSQRKVRLKSEGERRHSSSRKLGKSGGSSKISF